MLALIGLLTLTNIATIWWCFNKRLPATKQTLALKNLIRAFEVEGESVLWVQKINPDHMFLMNPDKREAH